MATTVGLWSLYMPRSLSCTSFAPYFLRALPADLSPPSSMAMNAFMSGLTSTAAAGACGVAAVDAAGGLAGPVAARALEEGAVVGPLSSFFEQATTNTLKASAVTNIERISLAPF